MVPISSSGMKNVLDLTRAGDLTRATDLIQQMLAGKPIASTAAATGQVIDITPRLHTGGVKADRSTATAPVTSVRANTTKQRFTGKGGALAYDLYVPATAADDMPLVIMLHGCNQSARDFALGTRMNEFAEEFGFVVAYPEQPSGANAQRCWNWFRTADQGRDSGEAALIAGLTREIAATQAIDRSRIYIAGLSAGGAAAANMAAAYPDLYAAVGIHSGLACGAAKDMPGAFAAMNGGAVVQPIGDKPFVPTITFHGGRDGTVKPINSTQIHDRQRGHARLSGTRLVEDQGVTASGRRYVKAAQVDASGRSMSENWTVPDAGHAWAGGSAAGSYTDPTGPDSSRELVRFFLQHQLDGVHAG